MTWRVDFSIPRVELITIFELALEPCLEAISARESDQGESWLITGYSQSPPQREEIAARIAIAAMQSGIEPPEQQLRPVEDVDWIEEFNRKARPIVAGRFVVHGSHVAPDLPKDGHAIRIDPGRAFGSGEHATTRGCLETLDNLSKSMPIDRCLDLGCGSGVLAIGLAMIGSTSVVASDNDPVAVAVARENIERNGVTDRISVVLSQGFRNPKLRLNAPYGLIVANILADPLVRLAPSLLRYLSSDGRIILSGLTSGQQAAVETAYRKAGFEFLSVRLIDDWPTLLMRPACP